jgi:hypothetical protein
LFAPNGYIPLADIMKQADAKSAELGKWSKLLLEKSVEMTDDLDEDFFKHRASAARIDSFAELFEAAVHESLGQFKIHACHPDVGVWRFGFPVFPNLIGNRHLFTTDEHDVKTYNGVTLDWPSHEEKIAGLVQKKIDPWSETFLELPHTSPNLFYDRDTYTISLMVHDIIAQKHRYGLALSYFGYPFEPKDIRPFEGWALCIGSEFSISMFHEKLLDSFARSFCRAAFGDSFVAEFADEQPDVWRRFIGFEVVDDMPKTNNTIAVETAAFKELDIYLSENEEVGIKAEIKAEFGGNLGERAFERVWDRLRVRGLRSQVAGKNHNAVLKRQFNHDAYYPQ